MPNRLSTGRILNQLDVMEREFAELKRDILHSLVIIKQPKKVKASLYGSVRGGDVTGKMIEEAKRNLFRDLEDI